MDDAVAKLAERLARESFRHGVTHGAYEIAQALRAEREQCARIAENWNYRPIETASGIAAEIRKPRK